MSTNFTLTSTMASDSGSRQVTGTLLATGSTEQSIDNTFVAGGTNVSFAISFAHATLKAIILKSTVNMTIKVNNSTTPDLTINLVANWPWTWNSSDGYAANPFPNDVTTFFVTNTPAARLTGKVLN